MHTDRHRKIRLLVATLILVLVLIGEVLLSSDIGKRDFAVYWVGYQAFVERNNPYSETAISEVLSKVHVVENLAPFYSPPWTLVLLAPVLALPFQLAANCWLILGFAFAFGSALLVARLYDVAVPSVYLFFATGFMLPVVECLFLGQFSLMVVFFFVAAILALQFRRDILAGFLLVPATIKPQVFF